jgi:hypothetical protein
MEGCILGLDEDGRPLPSRFNRLAEVEDGPKNPTNRMNGQVLQRASSAAMNEGIGLIGSKKRGHLWKGIVRNRQQGDAGLVRAGLVRGGWPMIGEGLIRMPGHPRCLKTLGQSGTPPVGPSYDPLNPDTTLMQCRTQGPRGLSRTDQGQAGLLDWSLLNQRFAHDCIDGCGGQRSG